MAWNVGGATPSHNRVFTTSTFVISFAEQGEK